MRCIHLSILNDIKALKEVFWINPKYESFDNVKDSLEVSKERCIRCRKKAK
jgi:D-serine dehydratase